MFVQNHMTPNPVTIPPDTSVPEALRLMRERKIRRLPVVDAHGKLSATWGHIKTDNNSIK